MPTIKNKAIQRIALMRRAFAPVIMALLCTMVWLAPKAQAAAPTINSVGTFTGSTAGGDMVTISGTNFSNITSVKFGDNAASYTVNTSSTITATSPAATSAGVIDIVITNNLGEKGILYGAFVYTDATNAINRWIGGAAGNTTAWNTAANWSKGSVPVTSDVVYINGGTYQPTLPMSTSMSFFAMSVGPSSATTLTVGGNSQVNILSFTTDVTVGKSGSVTQTSNSNTALNTIVWNAGGRVAIASGGTLGSANTGYSSGNGPGGGAASQGCSHAAYGANGKAPYGDIKHPTDMGSGCGGNYGGGFVKVTASTMVVDGTINASANGYASGGSVWLNISNGFQGASTGLISVAGGSTGSGGRVAVYAANSTYAGKYYAYSTGAGAGTVYTNIGSQTNGSLMVDNMNYQATKATPEMSSGSITYDDFHVDKGGIFEIPTTASLSLASLAPSASSTYPGGIIIKGSFTVPNSTTLTNFNLVIAGGLYSDQNPVIGSTSSIELQNSNPDASWNIQNLTINSGGSLTHTANTTSDLYAANINASGSITINNGGSINANRKGYSVGSGPGMGYYQMGSSVGAGHGGYGYNANGPYGGTYGSIEQPFESGSGGSNSGVGGGRIKLVASSIINNGSITAAGSGSGYSYGAGGAGGSIWIDAGSISGTGNLNVTGGNSCGAGGGRIALYYDTKTMTGAISTYSDDTSARGGSGTLYEHIHGHTYGSLSIQGRSGYGMYAVTPLMKSNSRYESLNVGNGANLQIGSSESLTVDNLAPSATPGSQGYIQNNGQFTVPDSTTLVNYYIINNGAYSDQNPIVGSGSTYELQKTSSTATWNVNSLRIDNGGKLTHTANTNAETYALNVTAANDITINNGGSVNVLGKGYSCSNGPGAGGPAMSNYGNGGSYGGAGGRTNTAYPAVTYGSATQPINSGSGGSCYSGTGGGGSGGGVAILKSNNGNIIVNGSINANGSTGGAAPYGSGGSGGSIWLQANTVTGTGMLSANGGNAYNYSGASGGGGRIAFTYSNNLQVTSATPSKGKITGGDTVTLLGNGFSPSTLISFGANSATVTYNSATNLTVAAPAATTNGYVDVTAKNKYFNGTVTVKGGASSYPGTDGSIDPQDTYQVATLANGYEYAALTPAITSISPNYGIPAGGNTVTINGQNFMTNPSVEFGGDPASNVTFVSSSQLTALAPPHLVGTVDVKITNSDGGSVTAPAGYAYSEPPTVTSASPSSGTTVGGDTVIISGSNFTQGMSVKFGSNNASSLTVVSDTTIAATTPAGVRGYVDITITNDRTQSATLTSGFQYLSPAPQVTSFSPAEGTMAGGTTVTFTGSNFDTSMKAYFNGKPGSTLSASATTLRVQTPVGALGNASVTIKGPDTESLSMATPFTYVPAAYAFTAFPTSLHQTEAGLVTIQARDTDNQPIQMTQDTTVALSSTSATSQFSMNSSSGWGISSATIPAGSDHIDFYMKDTAKGASTITATGPDDVMVSRSLDVNSRYKLLVSGVSDPVAAGTPSSITVQTIDWRGNPINDYTGTIHFTSSDMFAQLPSDLQFTPEMQGNHTFVNGVTMVTNGEQVVTATDTNDATITGEQTGVTVENGYSGPASKLAVITDAQAVAANTSTSAITVQIQDSNGNPAPAPIATEVYITTDSNTGSFRTDEADNWTSGGSYAVAIPVGATAATFYYRDSTIGDVNLSMRDQISTTDTTLTDTNQTVVVGSGAPYRLSIATQESQLTNKWNPITITLRDDQDQRLTIGQNPPTIHLSSSSGSLSFASDALGTDATTTFNKKLVTGTSKLIVYVRSSSALQATIHLSDSQPSNGSVGLLDDDKLVNFVTQQATHLGVSSEASAAVNSIIPITITGLNDNGDAAPVSGDKAVSLSSTGTGMYSLSSTAWSTINSVIIPDGSSTVTIYYRNQTAGNATLYASSVYGPASRSITVTPATYSGLAISGQQNLQVDTPAQYAVSLRDLYGNQTTYASDQTIYLYTSSTTGHYAQSVSGPWTINSLVIPAGTSLATIFYKDSTLDTDLTLSASDQAPLDSPDSGVANGSLGIHTIGQTVNHLAITSTQQTIIAGKKSEAVTVQAQTADGAPARVGTDMSLSLSSSSQGQPEFYAEMTGTNPTTSVTIPAGASEASFYYRDTKAGAHMLRAINTSGLQTSQQITIVASSLSDGRSLIFTTPPQTKESGETSDAIRIATADAFGNEAPVGVDTTIMLSSDCAGGYSASPTIWENITDITIAAGESAAAVYFRSDISCSMQIGSAGFTDGIQPYTIKNGPYTLRIDGPTSLELNQTGTYTISLQDINGNVVSSSLNRTLYVSGDGLLSDTQTTVLLAGSTSQTITARAASTQIAVLGIRDEPNIAAPDTGLRNATATTSVAEGTPTQLGITSLTASPSTDTVSRLSVHLLNAYGGAVSAPNDTLITLSSTDPSGTFYETADAGSLAIGEVMLPQGTGSMDIYYKQLSAGQAYIYASNGSFETGKLDITSSSGAVTAYQLMASKNEIERGEAVTYTVTALDANGNAAVMHSGDSFYIDFSGGVISSPLFNPTSRRVTVDTTRSAVTFTLTAAEIGSHVITISDTYPRSVPDTGIADAAHTLSIIYGAPAKLAFISPPRAIERGGVSDTIQVQVQNAHGAPTLNDSDLPISIVANSPTGRFATSTGGPWNSSTFALQAGDSALTLYYSDSSQPSTWQMIASAPQLNQASQNITVTNGIPVSLHFVNAPTSLVSYHDSTGFALVLRNRFGYPTSKNTEDKVVLSTDAPNGEFADGARTWQTNILSWGASSRINDGPVMYYRSYTTGANIIKAALPGIIPAELAIEILPQLIDHFVVTNISDPIRVGVPSSIVVIAKDVAGYTVPSYAGTISFTASDPHAMVPSPYTFVPSIDRGSHTFVNGVMFEKGGEKMVTASDHVLGISGTQTAITVLGKDEPMTPIESSGESHDTTNADGPASTGESRPEPTDTNDDTSSFESSNGAIVNNTNGERGTTGVLKPFVTALEAAGSLAARIGQSQNAAYIVPTAAFSTFFGYALLMWIAAYREAKNASVLAAILRREKKTADEKDEFINLLSHHLRTPVAILSGMIDLISFKQKDRDMSQLKNVSSHIQADIDAVLATATTASEHIESHTEPIRDVYRSARFWLPIIIAIVLTVVINIAINSQSQFRVHFAAYVYQAALVVVTIIGLYIVLRNRALSKREYAELQYQIRMRKQLDDAKNRSLDQLAHTLDNDLTALELVSSRELDTPSQTTLIDAESRLRAISETARVISSINTVETEKPTLKIAAYLKDYLGRKSQDSTKIITQEGVINEHAMVSIDPQKFERILDSVFDNAWKYSRDEAPIAVSMSVTSENVMISIANHGTAVPEQVALLQKPFMRGVGTMEETVQGLGLSLYAGRLVLDSYGGNLTIESRDETVLTKITLPRT